MTDGSKPLENRKHEAFCLMVAEGSEYAPAYRATISGKGKAETSHKRGSELASSGEVRGRIAWLRSEASKRLETQANGTVLSIAEKREFLAKVLRTPLGEVDQLSVLCQEWSETHGENSHSRRFKMPDKLAAIKLDNDLAGEGSEAKGNDALGGLAALLGRLRK